MRKFILFIYMTSLFLFAQNENDIALTVGYNKFDDPAYLRDSRMFYGIRGGVYQDDYGFQLGYEQANGANCQGLNLKRVYLNALAISNQPNGMKPYALLSMGYEHSNIQEHKPSQAFLGLGIGIRKKLTLNINGFLESRILRKLKSDDTDIITTVGLAYVLNNDIAYDKRAIVTRIVEPSKITTVDNNKKINKKNSVKTHQERYTKEEMVIVPEIIEKHYYIQMVALFKTKPDRYIDKLYKQGIDNVEVRDIIKNDRDISIVVVGPFYDRDQAVNKLHRLKKISRDAFITRF